MHPTIFAFFAMVGQTQTVGSAEINCSHASNMSALGGCALVEEKQVDDEREFIYKEALKKLDSNNRTRLQAAEEAWKTYRDKTCDIFGSGGGTGSYMETSSCRLDHTRAHIQELKLWIEPQD